MKTLLLSLLAMVCTVSMWATDVTLVEYNHETMAPTGVETSGTTVIGNAKTKTNTTPTTGIKFANGYTTSGVLNDNYVKLSYDGGFKAGDVVAVSGFFNNSDNTKTAAVDLFTADGDGNVTVLFTSGQFINGRLVDDDPVVQTYTLESDADVLYFGRNGNTSAFIYTLKITRATSQSASDLAVASSTASVNMNETTDVTYTTSSTGDVSVASSNEDVATATVDAASKTVTILGGDAAGTATITLSQAADDNYTAGTQTIAVTVVDPSAPVVIADWNTVGTFKYTGVTEGTVKIHENKDEVSGMKLSSSFISGGELNQYVTVDIEGGFKKGDVVSLAGAFNNSDDTKQAAITVGTSADNIIYTTAQVINGRLVADEPVVETFTLAEDADFLYFGRTGNTSTYVTKFTVKRPVVTPEASKKVTLNAAGYATFSNDKAFYVDGADVYTAKLDGTKLNMKQDKAVVAAGDGVVLYGEANTEVSIFEVSDAAKAVEDNAFKATTLADGSLAPVVENDYVMQVNGNTFVQYDGTSYVANKAYVVYSAGDAAKLSIVFDDDENTLTAVAAVEAADAANASATKKVMVNGQFCIVTANGTFTAAGTQVK